MYKCPPIGHKLAWLVSMHVNRVSSIVANIYVWWGPMSIHWKSDVNPTSIKCQTCVNLMSIRCQYDAEMSIKRRCTNNPSIQPQSSSICQCANLLSICIGTGLTLDWHIAEMRERVEWPSLAGISIILIVLVSSALPALSERIGSGLARIGSLLVKDWHWIGKFVMDPDWEWWHLTWIGIL